MDTNATIDRIYQRHVAALRRAGGDTWCDFQAAQVSLHLALTELAEHLAVDTPAPAPAAHGIAPIVLQQRLQEIEDHLAALQDAVVGLSASAPCATQHAPTEENQMIAPIDEALRQRCLDELRRLANNGRAPTKEQWDELRGEGIPDADEATASLRMSWNEFIAAAGLRRNGGRPGAIRAPKGATVVAADIAEHVAKGAVPVPDGYVETSLQGRLRREETAIRMLDGKPVKTTRQYIELR